jgi:branched-chain amino acid transport system permease protein
MAQGSEVPVAPATTPDAGIGRLQRLPVRRLVQIVLAILIIAFVAIGSYKTLTLPVEDRYSASAWKAFVISGVALGGIYALVALGYTLVYGVLRMINFAHGEVMMMGCFISFFFAEAYAQSGFLNRNPFVALLVIFVVAMLASCLVAMLLERVAYRPLRTAPRLVPLITAVGASLFLQNTALGFFGPQTRAYPVPDILAGDKTWTLFGITMQRIQVIVIATAAVAVIGLTMLISRTRAGKSIRAVAEDREIASLMGIDVDRAILITFALGGLLAGVAAVQFGMTYGQVNFHIGFSLGIAAFTASVLGGIGNIRGAALGGLILGLLYSVGPALLFTGFHIPAPFQLQDVITFSVLVLVLIFRPGGILGSGEEEKV